MTVEANIIVTEPESMNVITNQNKIVGGSESLLVFLTLLKKKSIDAVHIKHVVNHYLMI